MTDDGLNDDGYGCRREERRGTNRYPIQANTWFQWLGSDGCLHDGNALSGDISSHGLFVQCASVPVVGAAIEVVVSMPPGRPGSTGLQIRGRGKVAREVADRGFGAALVFHIERPETFSG
jgi:hypothetical protein